MVSKVLMSTKGQFKLYLPEDLLAKLDSLVNKYGKRSRQEIVEEILTIYLPVWSSVNDSLERAIKKHIGKSAPSIVEDNYMSVGPGWYRNFLVENNSTLLKVEDKKPTLALTEGDMAHSSDETVEVSEQVKPKRKRITATKKLVDRKKPKPKNPTSE